MTEGVQRTVWAPPAGAGGAALMTREWLVTNGLGGYASGTVAGIRTRRYHGYLIAALGPPHGRMMMLNQLTEQVKFDNGMTEPLGCEPCVGEGAATLGGVGRLEEFCLDLGLPVWRFRVRDAVIEKQVVMPHSQNTVYVLYRLLSGPSVRLELRPALHFRPHGGATNTPLTRDYILVVMGDRYEIGDGGDLPPLRMMLDGTEASLVLDGGTKYEVFYRAEADQGYEPRGLLWNPGHFAVTLAHASPATLVASTESWHTMTALAPAEVLDYECQRRARFVATSPPALRDTEVAGLILAANQFIVHPAGRVAEVTRAGAAGDEVRAVVAGYHWFTDWGRDTMISLEGLTLVSGRYREAGWLLRAAAYHIRDGLIPNLIPEGREDGLYHTADATLWYFHALQRYMDYTGDRSTLGMLLPRLKDVIDCHLRGTRFGIRADPSDGLLVQGAPGYQLTWMDAKVDDWVVTPRRGKAVEINALWYNALCLLEGWLRQVHGEAAALPYRGYADQVRRSFSKRFWYEHGGYLYDVVDGEDGDDSACRPNQLLAIALDHPVLEQDKWRAVVAVAEERLVTPVGLRSLAPGHPDYKSRYYGDLRARDAAYHQGTVWAWLIGPFIDAWLKVHPGEYDGARGFLTGFVPHLSEAGVGTISEIFDADPPFTPRGCVAQAWSVAEVLRCWMKTARVGGRTTVQTVATETEDAHG